MNLVQDDELNSALNVSHESSPPITIFSEIFALLLIMMPSIDPYFNASSSNA